MLAHLSKKGYLGFPAPTSTSNTDLLVQSSTNCFLDWLGFVSCATSLQTLGFLPFDQTIAVIFCCMFKSFDIPDHSDACI